MLGWPAEGIRASKYKGGVVVGVYGTRGHDVVVPSLDYYVYTKQVLPYSVRVLYVQVPREC